ncbi:GNAT family N-acetyltransferase [Nonomuraea sp. SYSU D8015]|uniref:GNAT family N-acetyltransferase n=1 Tax=Nonomuraea sp. SYSU D8015 TaxID=2593644 RepID=UPI001660E556|nr:GNAT family N-acetyltransferase [Nonomuraea sp. SYSU D8015]
MAYRVHQYDQPGITPISPHIIELYRRCYAAPPWSETPEQLDGYPAKLAAATKRPGFTALTARDDSGRLAGVCYGWPTPADLTGSHIYDALVKTFGPDATAALTRDAFEVAELFVHPEHQGRGIGRRLLAEATGHWPAAWLITDPQAPAAALYRKLGWREFGALPADFYPQLRLSVFARADMTA